MLSKIAERKKWAWRYRHLCVLILVLLLFFYDVLFLGKTLSTSQLVPGTTSHGPYFPKEDQTVGPSKQGIIPFSFDLSGNAWVNEPNPYIIERDISSGSFPGWNAGEGLGIPIAANPNTEVFNPAKLFLNLHPSPFIQDLFFLLRILLMGIFTFLFLTELGLSSFSSLFGSAFFMLSGYSLWWINLHPLSSMAYIPGLFYCNEKIRTARSTHCKYRAVAYSFLFSILLASSMFGGKMPVVVMGLMLLVIYTIYGDLLDKNKLVKGQTPRIILLIFSGTLMAAALLLPFMELMEHSSLLAKSVRTGASSHTLSLLSSITVWQPLFLGLKGYFYGSWLKLNGMMPYAGIIMLLLYIYGNLNKRTLLKILPFSLFALFLFLKIYGILPNDLFVGLPVIGSTNFIKYHGMFYFCLAIISAHSIEQISRYRFITPFSLASIITSIILICYFYYLFERCPPEKIDYIIKVIAISVSGLLFINIIAYISGRTQGAYPSLSKRKAFLWLLFLLMVTELYIYMPGRDLDRVDPYISPPYLERIKEDLPYRVIGDVRTVPPLVSSAIGLYDIRGINVLISNNYYLFFENLISFSVPYTNNPDFLVAATSPFIDLTGVKYVLSQSKLDGNELKQRLINHLEGLRTIRFFDAMKDHDMRGSSGFRYFNKGHKRRFGFMFSQPFRFRSSVNITEPYIFIGLILNNSYIKEETKVKVSINQKPYTMDVNSDGWTDRWIDISEFVGETIDIVIESGSRIDTEVILGSFGFSRGRKWEKHLLDTLYERHKNELNHIEYLGNHEGVEIYKNTNVMKRAFMLHKMKSVDSFNAVISELIRGHDFREIGLVSGKVTPLEPDHSATPTIRKYSSNAVHVDVNSGGGLLVLSDLYYPGWQVEVNGEEREILKVFGCLKGVVVPKGKNEVIFYFRPITLYVGMAVSLISLAMWILFLVRTRRSPDPDPGVKTGSSGI